MKLIIAIIQPEQLDAVEVAIHAQDMYLMSASQVLGDRLEPGRTTIYRGTQYWVQRPKVRLEIAVDDWYAEAAVEAIARAGSRGTSGQMSDCKICVIQLDGYVAAEVPDTDRWPSEHKIEDPWRS